MTNSGLSMRGGGRRGQGLSEYGLVLVLVGIICVVALTQVGEAPRSQIQGAGDDLGGLNGGGGEPINP